MESPTSSRPCSTGFAKRQKPAPDDMVDAIARGGDVLKEHSRRHRGEDGSRPGGRRSHLPPPQGLCPLHALHAPAAAIVVPAPVPHESGGAGLKAGYDLYFFALGASPGAISGGLASLVRWLGSFGRWKRSPPTAEAGGMSADHHRGRRRRHSVRVHRLNGRCHSAASSPSPLLPADGHEETSSTELDPAGRWGL